MRCSKDKKTGLPFLGLPPSTPTVLLHKRSSWTESSGGADRGKKCTPAALHVLAPEFRDELAEREPAAALVRTRGAGACNREVLLASPRQLRMWRESWREQLTEKA